MIQVAQKLGADGEFVRVDLHKVGDRIFFGELTTTPVCGLSRFEPRIMDDYLGGLWSEAGNRLHTAAR